MNVFNQKRLTFGFTSISIALETKPIFEFPDKWHYTSQTRFSPDGKSIIVSGKINHSFAIAFLDIQTGQITKQVDLSSWPDRYSVSEDLFQITRIVDFENY